MGFIWTEVSEPLRFEVIRDSSRFTSGASDEAEDIR
jgi:hypothetical protein